MTSKGAPTMKQRLFSILLALCMTLAMLPAAAFAKPVSYNGEIIIENNRWEFADDETVCYYIPGKNGKFSVNRPNSGSFLKVTKTGENEITITVFGNVTLQGKKALSANDENAIKSIKNLIITGATGKDTLSLSTTTDATAISVLGDLTVTGIALTATAGNGHALRANNITVSDATLIATNNSADSAAIQATQGDGPLGNLTVSGTSAITVTNKNANGRAIHATIINGNTDGRSLTVNGNETPGQTDASQVTISSPAPHSHVCSDGWTSDATGHWHRCADANCTEKLNFAAHTGGTATCTAKKKCEICNQSYGKLNPSNHTALSDWASDETDHWKDCADCNATGIDNAAHTYGDWIIDKEPTATEAGLKHRTCSDCHYKEMATIPSVPCTHERSTPWEPAGDGVHHVKKCADCGAIIEKAAHSGGTATCNAKKKCKVCGEPYGGLDTSNHTDLSDWKFDETGHWKDCADCNTIGIDNAAHTFDEWIIDKEATTTEAGLRHRTCSVCHYKETAAIPPVPCTHEGSTWVPAGDGVHHVKKCADCGAEPAIEKHNFAYCDNSDNSHTMTCDICGEARIEPHDFSHKTVPVDDGKHRGQCVCGAFDAAEEHAFENGSCTVCGAAAPTPAKPTPGGSGIIITPEAADPAFLSGTNQTVAVGGSAVFRIDYNYAAFRSVAVDGVTLTPADYTTWDGSTWVKLTAAYTKSLTPGTHTLSVYFDGATAATTFTVGGQPNPATGARDAVGIAAAAAVIALLGSAALLRKK